LQATSLKAEVDGNTADSDETTEFVVLAANGASRAARVSGTDDGDGVAGKTDEDVQVLENDAQKSKDLGSVGTASLLGRLTALDGAGIAVAGWNTTSAAFQSGGGHSQGSEGRSEEDGGLREHG
jgi:hypothetical protein